MSIKSPELGRTANGLLSLAGAVAAFSGLIQALPTGATVGPASLLISGCFVFGASVLRVIVVSFVPGKLRFGASVMGLTLTAIAAVVLAILGGSGSTIWATILLAAAPLAQDLLTPDPDWLARVVPDRIDGESQGGEKAGSRL